LGKYNSYKGNRFLWGTTKEIFLFFWRGNYENIELVYWFDLVKKISKSRPLRKSVVRCDILGFLQQVVFDLNIVEGNIKRLLKIGVVLIRIVFTTIKI